MNFKLLIFLTLLVITNNAFCENIGLLKELNPGKNKKIFKHHIEQVIESFDDNVVVIDYYNMINWDLLKNQNDAQKEKVIYDALSKFFKKNHIKKIIIGGDNYNYNAPKYHPEPKQRFYFTKVLTKMIREKKIKVFAICGGMQGILYFNDIELDSVKNILNDDEGKYHSSGKYMKNEQFYYDKKTYRSCMTELNPIYIKKDSYLANLMVEAEKKHKIKFQRYHNKDLITHTAFFHFNAVSNKPENLKKLQEKNFKIVGLSEDDIIYIVEDENQNLLIEGHPEIAANIIRCSNSFSKEDMIFSRLLFENLLNKSHP
jgi:gamma-glutamyl-gamma-aminobutyrate hydrolase PuuD